MKRKERKWTAISQMTKMSFQFPTQERKMLKKIESCLSQESSQKIEGQKQFSKGNLLSILCGTEGSGQKIKGDPY